MRYVLALDQGTTSSRAVLFDAGGAVCGMAQRELTQRYPKPGWVEHDPREIWEDQVGVAREVLSRSGVEIGDVAAIGITNQRETTVVWDPATGEPLAPAIVWQDRRTADLCDRLKADGAEAMIHGKTGLVVDPYFSATKLRWLLDNVDGLRAKAEQGRAIMGTVDAWLVWNLTGGRRHATDVTNASRTMLFDIHAGQWDGALLELFGVPRSMLPEVVASSGVLGETDPRVLGRAVPIAGIAGDQQAALFGQLCTRPGMAKNTYGTGCFLLLNTGEHPVISAHNLLTTAAWRIGGNTDFALEGSVFVAGAVVQWLRDGLGLIKTAADIEALARGVPDSGGVYLVPAFVGLGAPHWDPRARGLIAGLTRGVTAGHIARAALEGIAFQTLDVIRLMAEDAGMPLAELRVDGGASRNNLLMQIQADLLGVPVVRSAQAETTALGAAYLAGLATGVWGDLGALASHWHADRTFEPVMDPAERERLCAGWRKALDRAKAWEEG
ncbi:MAG: glycerol kinase GlpK [Verrucomicrobiae bacterium]|nr:glycerol kinase GlpK [Verrucomicrobiae bacterium]